MKLQVDEGDGPELQQGDEQKSLLLALGRCEHDHEQDDQQEHQSRRDEKGNKNQGYSSIHAFILLSGAWRYNR